MEQQQKLSKEDGNLFGGPERYTCLVGRLLYLTNTRLDIIYALYILSQFMQEPRLKHWEAALRIVHYIKGSPRKGSYCQEEIHIQMLLLFVILVRDMSDNSKIRYLIFY